MLGPLSHLWAHLELHGCWPLSCRELAIPCLLFDAVSPPEGQDGAAGGAGGCWPWQGLSPQLLFGCSFGWGVGHLNLPGEHSKDPKLREPEHICVVSLFGDAASPGPLDPRLMVEPTLGPLALSLSFLASLTLGNSYPISVTQCLSRMTSEDH